MVKAKTATFNFVTFFESLVYDVKNERERENTFDNYPNARILEMYLLSLCSKAIRYFFCETLDLALPIQDCPKNASVPAARMTQNNAPKYNGTRQRMP